MWTLSARQPDALPGGHVPAEFWRKFLFPGSPGQICEHHWRDQRDGLCAGQLPAARGLNLCNLADAGYYVDVAALSHRFSVRPALHPRRAAAYWISSGAGLLGGELSGDLRGAALHARVQLTLRLEQKWGLASHPQPLEGIWDGWRRIDYQSNVAPKTRQKKDCQAVRSVLYSNRKNGDANIAVAGSDSILR